MARYEDITAADAISEAEILGRLQGDESETAEAAQPARLVAGWTLDPATGRLICYWTATQ